MGLGWIFRAYTLFVLLFTIASQLGCGDNRGTAGHNPSLALHQPLLEQYIWFASTSADSSSPRFFRKSFVLSFVPAQATFYFVGPYNSDIFVNGTKISHLLLGGPVVLHDRPVVVLSVAANLRSGSNTIHGSVSGETRQGSWQGNDLFANRRGIPRPDSPGD